MVSTTVTIVIMKTLMRLRQWPLLSVTILLWKKCMNVVGEVYLPVGVMYTTNVGKRFSEDVYTKEQAEHMYGEKILYVDVIYRRDV